MRKAVTGSRSSRPGQGLFITFEGGEGCGKSTQARALYRNLTRQGHMALLTHEPGGTDLGNRIRFLLKRQIATPVCPEAEVFLFAASRAQLVREVILPALEQGTTVICDRFGDSTVVYQGYGRGVDPAFIRAANDLAAPGLKPDLTILLNITPSRGLARKRNPSSDRYEMERRRFHERVRRGYLKEAATDPERWLVIDGTLPQATVQRLIRERVAALMEKRQTDRHG